MRFLLVGLTNNAFIFGLYSILVYSDVNSVLAVTITFPLGMALSYVAQRFWSFRLREIGTSSILRFLVLSGLDYALNASMIWILTDVARLNPYVGQAMCIGLIAAVNFFLMRYWVYRSD
jgi:putative flippase GtrA